MARFRKRPVVIDAIQWRGDNWDEIHPWIMQWGMTDPGVDCIGGVVSIRTLEGEMTASVGDWIINGTKGEFYPCKPDIFAEVYEDADVVKRWHYRSENILGNAHDAAWWINEHHPEWDVVSMSFDGENGTPGSVTIVVYRTMDP